MLKDRRSRTGYEAAGLSDRGRSRLANEDAFGFHTDESSEAGDFVVCDGMGGAAAGEIASRVAADAMLDAIVPGALTAARIRHAVNAANRSVHSRSKQDPGLAGMGTTLVSLSIRGLHAWVANIGDSRCYRLRGGVLERLTHDHSLVDEQVRLGQLTAEQAAISPLRNVITRAVGTEAQVAADILEIDVAIGDLYLLATDGLTRELADQRIAGILRSDGGPERLCEELIGAANRAGGRDNITCVLVRAFATGSMEESETSS